MNFYQELQLNQSGSKEYIASFKNPKDKLKHILIYLFKILLTISFSTMFITVFSLIFGNENSITGLAVLLCIMTFRFSDFGIHASHSIANIFIIYVVFAIGPKLSNLVSAEWAFGINIICIMTLVILGCHNVKMFNHSIILLSYLFLQYYDVSGEAYKMRLIGLSVGAALTAVIFYCKHRNITYECSFKSLFKEFDLSSSRTRWQFRITFGISSAILIASLVGFTKPVWAGIAAMSVLVPVRDDLTYRVKFRVTGSIFGTAIFFVLYFILPEEFRSCISIIGGVCQGLSASYCWQTAFNTLSALAVSAPVLGFANAIIFRIVNNIFGSIYALLFDKVFEWFLNLVNNIKNRFLQRAVSE